MLKKYYKLIAIGLVSLIIIGLVSGYFLLATFQNKDPENRIIWEFNNLGTFTGDRKAPSKNGIDDYLLGGNYKIVQTKFDFQKPTYTILLERPSQFQFEKKIIDARVVYMERTGLRDWKVINWRSNQIDQITFSEATNLASRYDLTTDFPGKENYKITNYEPLTTQEIENNRKLRETNNKSDIIFKKYADIYFAAEKQGNAAKKKAILEEIIPGLQNILNQLNEGKTVPGTGGDIIPDQESKDLIQTSINEFEKEVKNL